MVKNLPAMQEARGFDPCIRKIPWRREWQPTAVFLSGESQGQRSLEGYSPWGRRLSNSLSRRLIQEAPPHQTTRGQHLPAPAHPRGTGLGEEAAAGSASSTAVSSSGPCLSVHPCTGCWGAGAMAGSAEGNSATTKTTAL